jgi:uncharacterized protein YdcH (DUF465 family)
MKTFIVMTMEVKGAQQNEVLHKLNQLERKLDHIDQKHDNLIHEIWELEASEELDEEEQPREIKEEKLGNDDAVQFEVAARTNLEEDIPPTFMNVCLKL